MLKIDIVCYDDSESCYALYIDGKKHMAGDYYHDKMQEVIDGFIQGLEYAKMDIEVKNHELTEAKQEKFAEDGYDYPEKFPNKYIK